MTYLIVNCILYFFALLVYYSRKGVMDIGFFILLIFVLSSLGSCWYYSISEVAESSYYNFSFISFVYLFILIILCVFPILKFDFRRVRYISDYNLKSFLFISSIVFGLLGFVPLIQLILKLSTSTLGNSLGRSYESNEESSNFLFSGIGKICFGIIRRFPDVIFILLFYQLSLKKRVPFLIFSLISTSAVFILFGLLSGSRGGVLHHAVALFSVFLILRHALEKKLVKLISRVGLILVSGVALAVSAISLSRFNYSVSSNSNYTSIWNWISQYLGEGMIRFSHTIWGLDKMMWGEQNFNYLLDFLGLEKYIGYDKFVSLHSSKVGTPIDVFYTFIGDFVLDFGLIGAIVMVVMLYLILNNVISKIRGKVEIWQLIVMVQFCHMFFIGFAANIYRGYFVQEGLIFSWMFAFISYMIPRLNQK